MGKNINKKNGNKKKNNKKKNKNKKNSNKKKMGLNTELTSDQLKRANSTALEILNNNDAFNCDKNLEKDKITVPGQEYAVVCWIGPTFKAKTSDYGFRIMGAFELLEEARDYAEFVNSEDPMYDTGVMQMNHFCLGYADKSDFFKENDVRKTDSEAQSDLDAALNVFICDHKLEIEEKKQIFELRKEVLIQNKNKTREQKINNAPVEKVPEGKLTKEMEEVHNEWKGIKQSKKVYKKKDWKKQRLNTAPSVLQLPGQKIAVITFIGNTGKNKRIPINIRGIFNSSEEASSHIETCMGLDDTYDMVPTEMYSWIPCDPDLKSVKEVHKDNKEAVGYTGKTGKSKCTNRWPRS